MKREMNNLKFTNDTDVGELSRIKALLYQHLEGSPNTEVLGKLYLDLGEIYLRIRNYPLAHQAWEKASTCFKDQQSNLQLAETYYQQGLLMAREGQDVQALEKWQQALSVVSADYRDEIVLQCKILYEMGQTLLRMGDLNQGEKLFFQGLELSQQIQTSEQEAMARQGLARCYFRMKRYTGAHQSYIQALRIWMAQEEKVWGSQILRELGELYQERGEIKRAIHALKSCLRLSQQAGQEMESRVDITLQLAWLYLKVDLEVSREYCKEVTDLLMANLGYRLNAIQEKQLARVCYILAIICSERQERKKTLIFCKQSMQIYQKYRLEDEWDQVVQLYSKYAPAEEREKFSRTRDLVNTLSRHEKLRIHNF